MVTLCNTTEYCSANCDTRRPAMYSDLDRVVQQLKTEAPFVSDVCLTKSCRGVRWAYGQRVSALDSWQKIHGSSFMAHRSWRIAHGSWLVSWLMAHGSWLLARGSWLVARGSWLVARGSWLVGHGSWLLAHGS